MKKTYLRIRKVQNNKRTEIAEIGFKINQKQNTQHGKYKKNTNWLFLQYLQNIIT